MKLRVASNKATHFPFSSTGTLSTAASLIVGKLLAKGCYPIISFEQTCFVYIRQRIMTSENYVGTASAGSNS